MQDRQNLFPQKAFQHKDWQVDETSQVLRAMRAIEDLIIVGVYSDERRSLWKSGDRGVSQHRMKIKNREISEESNR